MSKLDEEIVLIDTWIAIPVVYFPLTWKNHQGLSLVQKSGTTWADTLWHFKYSTVEYFFGCQKHGYLELERDN
jgi:hypothetical protein